MARRKSKKPWASITISPVGYEDIVYKDYTTLKKNLIKLINKSWDRTVCVTRTRRGEWGQWFERWVLNENGKPYKTKETWL
jgi:hypothetical protein